MVLCNLGLAQEMYVLVEKEKGMNACCKEANSVIIGQRRKLGEFDRQWGGICSQEVASKQQQGKTSYKVVVLYLLKTLIPEI